mmetsp:Transcript_101250/g.205448  ORF Transcript_101250/g.205448 Transcript_101250/m.205448 type:complete len:88 (+) Transcript_101250:181-444(+)
MRTLGGGSLWRDVALVTSSEGLRKALPAPTTAPATETVEWRGALVTTGDLVIVTLGLGPWVRGGSDFGEEGAMLVSGSTARAGAGSL